MEQEKINKIPELNKITRLMRSGKNKEIKKLVEEGIDVRCSNDYYLYLSVWAENKEMQKYLIEIGLDPELTQDRLIAYPEDLAYLRNYKFAWEKADKLDNTLSHKNEKPSKKVKL